MKKRGKIVLSLSVTACLVAGVLACGAWILRKGVDVTRFGVKTGDPTAAEANRAALNRLLLLAPRGTTLRFPKGDYYLAASGRGGLNILNKTDLTLKGEDGSVLINTSFIPYMQNDAFFRKSSNILSVYSGRNVTVDTLTFDYRSPSNVSGEIVKAENGLVTFRPFAQYLTGEFSLKGGESSFCVNIFNDNGDPLTEQYLPDGTQLHRVEGEDGLFTIRTDVGKPGQKLCVRFVGWENSSPTVECDGVKGFTVKNVRILSAPTACFYCGGDGENYTFDGLKVASPEGSEAMFCSNADGIHFQGLRGKLTLRNCDFIGMGDDALNVHISAAKAHKVDGNDVTLCDARSGTETASFAKTGDRLEYFSLKGERLGEATVTAKSGSVYTLDDPPAGEGKGVLFNNLSRQPETLVENCTVRRGRARGLLLQTAKATVKDCTFAQLRLAGVLLAPDLSYWYEMGPCREADITGNIFTRVCTDAPNRFGAVTVTVGHDDIPKKGMPPVHGNIRVSGNTFEECGAFAVRACAAQNVDCSDNALGDAIVAVD